MSEPRSWRNVWVLSATIVGTITALYSWNRIIPVYLESLGATPGQIGAAYFCLVVAYRLPQILGGALTDRVGRKPIVVLGTFGMAAGYVAVALAPRWGLVVGAICGCWLIGALQWPALASLVADSVPERERGRAMGLLEAGSMVGLTLGPWAGRFVGEEASIGETWKVLLFGSCALYSLCGLARWILLRELPRHSPGAATILPVPWRRLFVPLVVIVLAFCTFYLTTEGPVLGLYVHRVTGEVGRVQTVGLYAGLSAIAGAAASGFLADRLGAGRTMALMGVLSAALLVPFGLGWLPPGLEIWAFSVLLLPQEGFVVAYQKLVTTVGPQERRGLAVGITGSALGLAASWAPALGGTLFADGMRLPILAAAAAQVLGLLLSLRLLGRDYN